MAESLEKALKKTIKKMKNVQKSIASDDQPVSATQLELLKQLGIKYAKIVEKMKSADDHDPKKQNN